MKDYNESETLKHYIWHNYRQLLSQFEREVDLVVIVRQHAQKANAQLAQDILDRHGRCGEPAIEAALEAGFAAFYQRISDRLLTEHPDQVVINRCPICHKILRTPRARVCVWCGHTWIDE